MQDLYTENYKTAERSQRTVWEPCCIHGLETLILWRSQSYPNSPMDSVQFKVLEAFFNRNWQAYSKLPLKIHRPNTQSSLEKGKNWGLGILTPRHCKTPLIKTVELAEESTNKESRNNTLPKT